MTYHHPSFTNITNDLIEEGIRRAHIERSRAFRDFFDRMILRPNRRPTK